MAPLNPPLDFDDLRKLAEPSTYYDPHRSFEDQLLVIDFLRSQSQGAHDVGDIENEYVYLGRAAALMSDYLPSHSQYNLLTAEEQSDLANVCP